MGKVRAPSKKQIAYGKRIADETRARRFVGGKWLCSLCGERKPESEYYKVKTKTGSPPSHCAQCSKTQTKRYLDKNRSKYRVDPKAKEANKMARLEKTLSQEMTCERCGKTKPRFEWPVERGSKKGGYIGRPRKYCCSPSKRTDAEVQEDIRLGSKICTSCDERKPFEQFSPNKLAADGRQTTCKKCRRAKVGSGAWRGSNTERKVRLAGADDGSVTTEFVKKMFTAAKVCPCCDGDMEFDDKTMDHIIPLARGGAHSASNVMVLCRSCNSSKRDRHPSVWLDMLNDEAASRMRAAYKKMGLYFG